MRSSGVRRAGGWAAAIALAFAAAGCGKPVAPAPNPGPACFPTGEPLVEGDVILARSFGMVGSFFALFGAAEGPYSHAATYFVDDCGRPRIANYRPDGMEVTTPEDYFRRYLRVALVRYRGAYDPGELSRAARGWVEQNRRQRIRPDYYLDRDDPSTMYCLELVGHIYRCAGLPDPFEQMLPLADSPLLSTVAGMFDFSAVTAVPSPNVVLSRPDFQVLARWEWEDYDLRREAINEELGQVASDTLVAGWRPRAATPKEQAKVRKGLAILRLAGGIMFWRPKEPLPSFVTREQMYSGFVMYKHIAKAKKTALAAALATPFPPPGQPEARAVALAEARRVARETAEALRPEYYLPPPAP